MTVAAPTPLGLNELVALFRGDEHTTGYPHPNLVVELCRRCGTPNAEQVAARIYPGGPALDELPAVARQAIDDGLAAWHAAGRPRA